MQLTHRVKCRHCGRPHWSDDRCYCEPSGREIAAYIAITLLILAAIN